MDIYPITTEVVKMSADLYTPMGVYLSLRDVYRDTILMESSDFHLEDNSWSVIAVQPFAGVEVVDKETIHFKYPNSSSFTKKLPTNEVLIELESFFKAFRSADSAHSMAQQFFGYSCFEAVQFIESISFKTNTTASSCLPLMRYRIYKYVIAFNHFRDELFLFQNNLPNEPTDLASIEQLIRNKQYAVYPFSKVGLERTNTTDETYKKQVRQGIHHCLQGDVFQIVLSKAFEQNFVGDDINVYRALRQVNPSPYLFYFDYGDYRIFGSSPESVVIFKDNKATIHPLAGTIKRSGTALQDEEQVKILLSDEKENAEHVMLVDLARNDLSRIGKNITVKRYKEPQYYSHVIHLASRVEADYGQQTFGLRNLLTVFPAGTLSGAPKIRAIELIDEIETTPRQYYGGCIGSLGLDGSCNQSILIRSFFSKQNVLHYQAGAGIVAQSVPEKELEEVQNKLNGLREAIRRSITE